MVPAGNDILPPDADNRCNKRPSCVSINGLPANLQYLTGALGKKLDDFAKRIQKRMDDHLAQQKKAVHAKNEVYYLTLKAEAEAAIATRQFYCESCGRIPNFEIVKEESITGSFEVRLRKDCEHFDDELTRIIESAKVVAMSKRNG